METPVITDTVSHYTVLKKLGAGGRGGVRPAEDTALNRKVAIKFLPADSWADQQAKRLPTRETPAAVRLDHPNNCTIHEVGEEAGRSGTGPPVNHAQDARATFKLHHYPAATLGCEAHPLRGKEFKIRSSSNKRSFAFLSPTMDKSGNRRWL
jgi:serine/threonine protein kinase